MSHDDTNQPDLTDLTDLTDPGIYGHWVTDTIRFSDMDSQGHVNNVSYAAYVETGRVAYGLALAADAFPGNPDIVLRRIELDYLSEGRYPGTLDIGSCLLRVGRTSFVLGTGVFHDGRCLATAVSVLVMVGPDGPLLIDDHGRSVLEAAKVTAG